MKQRIALFFLPLVAVGYACGALALGGGELWLALAGERAEGRIAGMLKLRSASADYVGRIDHRLEFHLADGVQAVVDVQDYRPVALAIDGRTAPLTLLSDTAARDHRLSEDFPRLVREAIPADAPSLRRLLQRQSRSASPQRLVRLSKIETAIVWTRLPPTVRAFELLDPRHAVPRGRALADAVVVTTRADFGEPPDPRNSRGDRMLFFSRTVDGQPAPTLRNDFILYDEPYETAQIPVFIFTAGTRSLALLSDLGRHGPPTLAFPVFGECTVAYDSTAPANALLMPRLSAPESAGSALDWFSRICESLFSRWGYVAILGFGSILAAVSSVLTFSLARRPSESPPSNP